MTKKSKKLLKKVESSRDQSGHQSAKESSTATPAEIAKWMLARIDRYGKLLQTKAVSAIEEKFGSDFIYMGNHGEWSIDRRILYHFRKLSGDKIVWVTSHDGVYDPNAYWRKRGPGDSPGRTQYDY